MVCKVNFAQAYDCVDLKYLRFMLRRMGFEVKWMLWIEAMVFTRSMSILVNDSLTEEFKVSRGLRQGGRFSPFLFIILAEGLADTVTQTMRGGLYNGLKVSEDVEVSLLQFVDDTLLIGDGSATNL